MWSDSFAVRATVEVVIADGVLPYNDREDVGDVIGYFYLSSVVKAHSLGVKVKEDMLGRTAVAERGILLTTLADHLLALIVVWQIREGKLAREYELTHAATFILVEADHHGNRIAHWVFKVGKVLALGKVKLTLCCGDGGVCL